MRISSAHEISFVQRYTVLFDPVLVYMFVN